MIYEHLALGVVVAALFAFIAKLFKQPLVIGYLFAGVLFGALGLAGSAEGLHDLGKIGVALLLFLVGLEMNISELPSVGKVALTAGLGQIVFTSGIGFILAHIMGYGVLEALYIGIALTFSSTIIIVKLLSEKNDLSSLYGRIVIGVLLAQDFVAVMILMFLGSLGQGGFSALTVGITFVKIILLVVVLFVISKKILPQLFRRYLDSSSELVFIFSLAWALGVSAFVGGPLGISVEIGGFLAGLALSTLPEHLQVASKTKPLRDFFLTLFFLVLGSNLVLGDLGSIAAPAIVFSIFVLIGNPIILIVIMGALGYKRRTSFSASVTLAQVSEFSLILITMGATLGHVTNETVALVVLVGVVTITVSTYLILHSDAIYRKVSFYLKVFERKNPREMALATHEPMQGHVVLIGCDRTGSIILPFIKKKTRDYIVVEHNPRIVKHLSHAKVPVVFGDIEDEDVSEEAGLMRAHLVISTTSNFHDNLVLLDRLKKNNEHPAVIVKSASTHEAMELYRRGADYVVVPEVLAGEFVRQLLSKFKKGYSKSGFSRVKKIHFDRLNTSSAI